MQKEIQQYLCTGDNWKLVVKDKLGVLSGAQLMEVTVTTIEKEGDKIYFYAAIIYQHANGQQRSSNETGVVTLDKQNKIVDLASPGF